jgi:ABC-2 type transport system ATP-binding protein
MSENGSGKGTEKQIIFEDVSKFYGDVLGVNRINLSIPPGITSLVGPNASGKTTLMNLMTGLVRPTRGSISVLGIAPDQPEQLFRRVGYCTQFDSFPRGITGYEFVYSFLRLSGHPHARARDLAEQAIERVGLTDSAGRKIAAYSKGMRQRIKLAHAICHDPCVLVLDEPLNGLDPLIRSETIALFLTLAQAGRHLLISSHVLHEVDLISDQVVLLSNGYVVAEGEIPSVRNEIQEHPTQILIRCNKPAELASQAFQQDCVVEARIHNDGMGVLVKTRDADRFYLTLNHIAQNGIDIESVAPADADVLSVYEYLVGSEESTK